MVRGEYKFLIKIFDIFLDYKVNEKRNEKNTEGESFSREAGDVRG